MATSSRAEILAELTDQYRQQQQPEVRRHVDDVANQGVDFGRSIAPVYTGPDPSRNPGTFRDSIHTERIGDVDGQPAARIESDDPAAAFIEYGTDKTPEHGTFAKIAAHMQQVEDTRVAR